MPLALQDTGGQGRTPDSHVGKPADGGMWRTSP